MTRIPTKTNVTIISRSVSDIEQAIKRRMESMRYDPAYIVKRATFSVYRFGESDTFIICLGKLDERLQQAMKVDVYREDIMPFYKLYAVED